MQFTTGRVEIFPTGVIIAIEESFEKACAQFRKAAISRNESYNNIVSFAKLLPPVTQDWPQINKSRVNRIARSRRVHKLNFERNAKNYITMAETPRERALE